MLYFRVKTGKTIGKNKTPLFKITDKSGKSVTDKKVLNYITNLVIPPAYDNVTIFYESSPKILFEGFDDKGRKQQIYSKLHKQKAMKKKFLNLLDFGKVLPKIHADINKYITNSKSTKNKIISLIIKIVMICGFRIGNLKYQKLYNSFGISNIFKNHIKMEGKQMIIKFIGKKGVLNECVISNIVLINEVNKLISNKTANDYVFTYKNDKGETNVIKAIEINKWLKSYHENITSKAFRTWDTNILFIEYMRNSEDPVKLTIQKRKKNVISALKVISCQINNTPAICKKEYLHGDLFELYINHPKKYKKYFFGCIKSSACFMNYLQDVFAKK
jgi:DNA topoisomerase-1